MTECAFVVLMTYVSYISPRHLEDDEDIRGRLHTRDSLFTFGVGGESLRPSMFFGLGLSATVLGVSRRP